MPPAGAKATSPRWRCWARCTARSAHRSLEVMGGDPQSVPEIEPVRIGTLGPDTGVELQLSASLASGLLLQPRDDRVGVTSAAQGGTRDEVVDVQKPARARLSPIRKPVTAAAPGSPSSKRCGDAVAGTALCVDPRDQFVGRPDVRAKLEEREGRLVQVVRLKFTKLGHGCGSRRSGSGADRRAVHRGASVSRATPLQTSERGEMAEIYTVGIWTVKAGREEEFVAAWRAMGEATIAEFPAAHGRLLRHVDNPGRFVSFGPWENLETVDTWRASAPFQEGVARIQELLDAFEPGTYELSAQVSASSSP